MTRCGLARVGVSCFLLISLDSNLLCPLARREHSMPAAWTRTCSARFLDSNVFCSLPGLELALHAAWTRTCSARCLDSKFLCTLPGLELVLPAAASFSDCRIFCLAVFCGPAVRFPTAGFRLLHYSYCFEVTI